MRVKIVIWLSANFDLPATPHGSEIRFTSKLELARMRAAGRAHWQGLTQQEETDELVQRTVVAVYDMKFKTILRLGRKVTSGSICVGS
jgi:hypothetical protein